MQEQKQRRVKGYPFDEVRQKDELVLRTYEYDLPFNYPNIDVFRKYYDGGEFHGIELFTQNQPSPKAELAHQIPGEWTLMKIAFTVPPRATVAKLLAEVKDMEPDGVTWLADAMAGVVPADWNEEDEIPKGTENLIANPTLSGKETPPRGWYFNQRTTGKISHEPEDKAGHEGLRLENACILMETSVPVKPCQRLVYALWVRSSNGRPGKVKIYPTWRAGRDGILSLNDAAGDAIIIKEDEPIVRVAVIGSACTPPGYVMLEAEPVEEFYHRGDFIRCTAPVRFRQNNLWGMHLRYDQWSTSKEHDLGYENIPSGMIARYPGMEKNGVKAHYCTYPFAGMSCAIFEIPKSMKVIVQGGSETTGWASDNVGCDDHYSFRTVRTTVVSSAHKET